MPFVEGSRDLHMCVSSKLKSEINIILGGIPFLSTLRPRVINIFHAKHISSGSQTIKVKFTLPPPTNTTMARQILGCPPYQQQSGGVFIIIIAIFDHGTGHPNYWPLLCKDEWINTHHENNSLSMEDTDHPLSLHEWSRHTKKMFIWNFRGGRCKFTWNGGVIPHIGRYGGIIRNNFGLRILMHK